MGVSGQKKPTPPFLVRREVPRFAFDADVKVRLHTGGHLFGRLSEISRKGCYVHISETPPMGTSIKLLISKNHETFTTDGTVIYANKSKGIGIAFKQTAPEQLAILDAWLGASSSLCFFIPSENSATK